MDEREEAAFLRALVFVRWNIKNVCMFFTVCVVGVGGGSGYMYFWKKNTHAFFLCKHPLVWSKWLWLPRVDGTHLDFMLQAPRYLGVIFSFTLHPLSSESWHFLSTYTHEYWVFGETLCYGVLPFLLSWEPGYRCGGKGGKCPLTSWFSS